jgi:hypothetical protein
MAEIPHAEENPAYQKAEGFQCPVVEMQGEELRSRE